mmetsp:Transcript_8870/g.17235  ORF Transcript_8870/g.17235 Transcript_8870/m.17235 type:complete len:286 (-) Transcript_8870:986-1843(-)
MATHRPRKLSPSPGTLRLHRGQRGRVDIGHFQPGGLERLCQQGHVATDLVLGLLVWFLPRGHYDAVESAHIEQVGVDVGGDEPPESLAVGEAVDERGGVRRGQAFAELILEVDVDVLRDDPELTGLPSLKPHRLHGHRRHRRRALRGLPRLPLRVLPRPHQRGLRVEAGLLGSVPRLLHGLVLAGLGLGRGLEVLKLLPEVRDGALQAALLPLVLAGLLPPPRLRAGQRLLLVLLGSREESLALEVELCLQVCRLQGGLLCFVVLLAEVVLRLDAQPLQGRLGLL